MAEAVRALALAKALESQGSQQGPQPLSSQRLSDLAPVLEHWRNQRLSGHRPSGQGESRDDDSAGGAGVLTGANNYAFTDSDLQMSKKAARATFKAAAFEAWKAAKKRRGNGEDDD
jgi:hypothetical protein